MSLERAPSKAALSTPEVTIGPLKGLIVIDEIQRLPQLFETLRPLSDRIDTPARFLALGSASPDFVRGVSESLAGRAFFISIPGFSITDIIRGNLFRQLEDTLEILRSKYFQNKSSFQTEE